MVEGYKKHARPVPRGLLLLKSTRGGLFHLTGRRLTCFLEGFPVRECRNRSLKQDRGVKGQPVPYRRRQLIQGERFGGYAPEAVSLYSIG